VGLVEGVGGLVEGVGGLVEGELAVGGAEKMDGCWD
jgi:hypothetical protein